MISRATRWLQPPDPDLDLSGFPTRATPETVLRAHHRDWPPGWFASVAQPTDEGGRFDLTPPHGTLYAANDVEAAVRERLGEAAAGRLFLAASDVADTEVSMLAVAAAGLGRRTANTLLATGFLTREIDSTADYALTRAWATAFQQEGLDGVTYQPRSTMGTYPRSYALFGPAGPVDLESWPEEGWREELLRSGTLQTRLAARRASIIF